MTSQVDQDSPDPPAPDPARASELRFRMLFELSPDPASLSRRSDGTLLMVNEAWCLLTGIPREEAIGRSPSALGAWSQAGDRLDLFRDLKPGMTLARESMLRRRDGAERQMLVTAKVLSIGDQEEVLIIGKDVTDFHGLSEALGQRTRELRRSETEFGLVFEKAPVGMAIVDSESGRFLQANPRLGEILGHSPAALLQTTFQSLTHPDHLMDDLESVTALRSGAAAEIQKEKRYLHRSGKVVWARLRMVRMPALPGEPPRHLALVEDITEARGAMEMLRHSEERFRRLIADLPVGVLIQSASAEIVLGNSKALELLGLDESRLLGRSSLDPAWDVIHEDGSPYPGPTRPAALAIATRRPVRDAVMGVRRAADGERIWVSAHAEPQLDHEGAVQQVICTFIDITLRKAAEAERERMQRRLHQAQRMESLGILVAGVAHTMNNVLAVAMGAASLRERAAADPADLEAYGQIGRVCERGREVVRSLMQFSKPALSDPAPFDIHALVKEVRTLLEHASGERVAVVAAYGAEPLWAHGDSGSVKMALVNLCFNSLEAMPEGGTLTLRCAGDGADWAEIAVEDTGIGMAPGILARAAEPFFTTKNESAGAGLGLSTVHGLVTAHGGTMAISSRPGLGTTVTLRLPRAPQVRIEARPRGSAVGLGRVLLVDDEEDVRILMRRMLLKAGVKAVETAAGGEEALASLASGALPEAIILDQNMPGMTGVQVLDRVRELHPDLPVLISSGQPGIETWPEFRRPRVGVISKPFTLTEIQHKLEEFGLL